MRVEPVARLIAKFPAKMREKKIGLISEKYFCIKKRTLRKLKCVMYRESSGPKIPQNHKNKVSKVYNSVSQPFTGGRAPDD